MQRAYSSLPDYGVRMINKIHRYPKRKIFLWFCVFLLGYHFLASKIGISIPYGDFSLAQRWKTSIYDWKTTLVERVAKLTISADGNVIVRTAHTLASLDARSGALLWKISMESGGIPSAAVIDGEVVFVAANKEIYAIDKSNGHVLWKSGVANRIVSSEGIVQAVSPCCVLVSTLKQDFIAYNRNTGEEMGILSSGGSSYARASVENDQIYIVNRGAKIVDGSTLITIWEQEWPTIETGVYFENGVAYFSNGYLIAAFDFHSHTFLWTIQKRGSLGIVAGDSEYLLLGSLYALDPKNGELKWSTDVGMGEKIIMEDRIYSLNPLWKQVRAYNLANGEFLGTVQLGLPDIMQLNYVSEAIGVYDNLLIVGLDEHIYGFEVP